MELLLDGSKITLFPFRHPKSNVILLAEAKAPFERMGYEGLSVKHFIDTLYCGGVVVQLGNNLYLDCEVAMQPSYELILTIPALSHVA
ncbi:hypothetical protein [Ferrimonas marina]|uniref:Uncharacterized protein n=1 Tax=Ferrimonas marina TaxID=299255 RepID=A0A1M5T5C3_9GAMM|nr:hypothetical protein [Ferrimonas marina]SHH45924.1 hypothetical protein SAMN02745129_2007 [Ferrimonas marina]